MRTFALYGADLLGDDGQLLLNVHHRSKCLGEACIIHNPSGHHMLDWPLNWRYDRHIFERLCPHGVGHPDPDQPGDLSHGCDGCCAFPQ